MFPSHTFTAQSPMSPHPIATGPVGWQNERPGRRRMAGVAALQAGTRRQQPQARSPHKHKLATPAPPSDPGESPSRAQESGRRKERPFKGSGEEKAFGEARARALFPLALIVRGVFGEEDSIVSQGPYEAGAE